MSPEQNNPVGGSILETFDSIQIKVASPETIKNWSFGEIKKAETINYRTLAPEKEGLFCQKIFGPVKDWECACGKYKRVRYRGVVCEVCGVEVTESRVRRYRMGHIKLAAPVVHIWYLKGIPSYLSLLLEIPLKELEQVVYFNSYMVTNPGNTSLKLGQILGEDEYDELCTKEENSFEAEMGAEAVLKLINILSRVEYEYPEGKREGKGQVLAMPGFEELAEELKQEIKETKASAQKRVKLIKRLRLIKKLLGAKIDPAWIVMDLLPVLPPELRPMVQLDGGRFATSDLNDLYRRVINRNNRLLKLKEMYAPEIIIRNEKRMLQEAVDALVDNGRRGKEVVGSNGRHLKSLSDIIEGKQGRFRQNLLGKRVDYSGRSVIVVGPKLKLHQCGVPAPILLELFKPFIIEKLIKRGLAPNIKTAKKMIEKGLSVVWETLETTIKDHPVLLNRAPTLHRLGIQAFEPVLVEGRAIQLHPLVCASFNADFDGDQMAIHVPLSVEAQAEARMLMLSSNNVLLPATGQPSVVPTQDMVLGLYYLTADVSDSVKKRGAGLIFSSMNEVIAAFEERKVHIHSKIKVRIAKGEIVETTVGRTIVNDMVGKILSSVPNKSGFRFVNEQLGKKTLSKLFVEIYEKYGTAAVAETADALKDMGFKYATYSGLTIGAEDLEVPKKKKELIKEAEDKMTEARLLYEKGEITEVERYNRVIDTWSETTDNLTKKVVEELGELNSIKMMAFSGARGNISQVRQLVGMRGLMADSMGKIIDQPIISNFREGLSVTEYIISSYGARKGIVDTALKTADSGYLTRRLVDVAQDTTIWGDDCGTENGIILEAIKSKGSDILSLEKRLFSRTVAEDIKDPKTGEIICKRNQVVNRELAAKICKAGIEKVKIRSPLTCESARGICVKCYGMSLGNNKPVAEGEAIGIIAAQSIGEPGTQLTMRTFHTGGAVAGISSKKFIEAKQDGVIKYPQEFVKEMRDRYGATVQQTFGEVELKVGDKESHKLPIGAAIRFLPGHKVSKGEVIAEYSDLAAKPLTERAYKDVLSDRSGQVVFQDFDVDEKQDRFGNISRSASKGGTIWVMDGQVYNLPSGSKVLVEDGQQVESNSVLTQTDVLCEHGGLIRFGNDIKVETSTKNGKPYNKLVSGKEIDVIIASIKPSNASVEVNAQGNFSWIVNEKEKYSLKIHPNESLQDGTIVGELNSDDVASVKCSGEIRYGDEFEGLDEKRTLKAGQKGKLYFIPEEIHSISKDISLKYVETGDRVSVGQEIVKDVITRIDGIVELKVENDIIYEAIVRPGEVYEIEDPSELSVEEDVILKSGTKILPKVKCKGTSIVNLITDESGIVKVFLRPVQEFEIEHPELKVKFNNSSDLIDIETSTQLLFKNGERVRSLEGGPLLRTSLSLKMNKDLSLLKAKVEFRENQKGKDELTLLVQDSILLRKEEEYSVTYLLVNEGTEVKTKDIIAQVQVLNDAPGEVRLSHHDDRKLLLITKKHISFLSCKPSKTLKIGAHIKVGDLLDEKNDVKSSISGQVIGLNDDGVIILKGRPYLISPGTQLQVETGGFVQRGDQLATLIFEQQKTGDIVQGLPKVEELLEGRKPKEPSLLAPITGIVSVEDLNLPGETRVVITDPKTSESVTVSVSVSQNVIVDNGQTIKHGEPITDGSPNPHQILEMLGKEAAQLYLINEVQKVYCSQGVDISDKHIEVIVKQMTMKTKIEDSGDTIFLPGEMIEMADLTEENIRIEAEGGAPATYKNILLGITKASLNTKSFISAASFQETTRILTESSLEGKSDELRGLKENIIVGKLIPGGTGYAFMKRRQAEVKEKNSSLVSARA